MGSGASAVDTSKINDASPEELAEALKGIGPDDLKKLQNAFKEGGAAKEEEKKAEPAAAEPAAKEEEKKEELAAAEPAAKEEEKKAEPAAAEPAAKEEEKKEEPAKKQIELTAEQKDNVRKAFDAVDTDKSGTVEVKEFMVSLKALNVKMTEDEVTAVFKKFDDNKDQKLQFDEYLSMILGALSE